MPCNATELNRIKVIYLFTNLNNNSTPNIVRLTGYSKHKVSSIINEYLESKRVYYLEEKYESSMNF